MSDTGRIYVRVIAKNVIVIDEDDDVDAGPREVYRIRPDGRESWLNGDWLVLGRQVVGDESTHHPADSVIGRAARKIQAMSCCPACNSPDPAWPRVVESRGGLSGRICNDPYHQ